MFNYDTYLHENGNKKSSLRDIRDLRDLRDPRSRNRDRRDYRDVNDNMDVLDDDSMLQLSKFDIKMGYNSNSGILDNFHKIINQCFNNFDINNGNDIKPLTLCESVDILSKLGFDVHSYNDEELIGMINSNNNDNDNNDNDSDLNNLKNEWYVT